MGLGHTAIVSKSFYGYTHFLALGEVPAVPLKVLFEGIGIKRDETQVVECLQVC